MSKEIPFWQPETYIKDGLDENSFFDVLESNHPNEGPFTERFEKECAALCGAKYAVATTSGTAALFLALKAMGTDIGHVVTVPDATFIATANAATLTGAGVYLVDVDDKLLIRPVGPVHERVVLVHISGRRCSHNYLNHRTVIEDSCELFPLSEVLGDAACFSFSPNKIITTGQGGMVITNDYAVYLKVRALKNQGRLLRGTGGDDIHSQIGFNFKFTDLQAALGLAQLRDLDNRIRRLRRNSEIYHTELSNTAGLRLLPAGEIPLWTDAICERRDELFTFLEQRSIHCRKFWRPIHTQEPYRRPDSEFPVATELMPKALWLPSAFTLSDEDVTRVCAAVKEFYDQP